MLEGGGGGGLMSLYLASHNEKEDKKTAAHIMHLTLALTGSQEARHRQIPGRYHLHHRAGELYMQRPGYSHVPTTGEEPF